MNTNEKPYYIHWVADYDPRTNKVIDNEQHFIEGLCDIHTHGLDKYNSLELQMILNTDGYLRVFYEIADKIVSGELVLYDGMIIKNMFPDGALIRIEKHLDSSNEPIWRIIIPDGEFKMPEDSEEYPYLLQSLPSPYIKDLFDDLFSEEPIEEPIQYKQHFLF